MTLALFLVAGVVAVADWVAVARHRTAVEAVAKPLALALLLAAAATADLGSAKVPVLVALGLGLVGDVALLLAPDSAPGEIDAAFLAGLTAFLLGHVAYLVAFARHGVHGWQIVAGLLVVSGTSILLTPRVLRAARVRGGPVLAGAVGAYSAVLAAMVVLGVGTAAVATAVGALLFLASDAVLAWDRFVQRLIRGPVLVVVTYHLAQFLLVIGLLR